ncbi:MAG: DUF4118 domain-containing protein, partial [Ktedonobacteraceae bacterium]|nr:DUF4118 domain-containing protein [Ktedonobacteraceae bacterium]
MQIVRCGPSLMQRFEYLLFLGTKKEPRWRRYISDALLAVGGAIIVTGAIFLFHLYPTIPDISLLYLLIVLGLASTRGLYSALVASVVAFLSFDFFMVPPFFTLTIDKFEEWLALFIFLVTAIITGQLAAALKQRAEQAIQSEREARTLYELVNATTSEEDLDAQLNIIVRAVVNVFATAEVRDCAIL